MTVLNVRRIGIALQRLGLLGLMCAILANTAQAYEAFAPVDSGIVDNGIKGSLHPALGINETFGRWTSTVKFIYDPDNAPVALSDPTLMVALIKEAAAQWERVCGIHFEVVGINSLALVDDNYPAHLRDGLIRISWQSLDGLAGQAGAQFGNYGEALGYFPFFDGSVELNPNSSAWNNSVSRLNTLVHEFGHLIGLGHSENPASVMFANPYNFLNYPREDDIRAVQALYGVGNEFVSPVVGVSEWHYKIPPFAPPQVTQFLFKPNQNSAGSSEAFLALSGNPGTAITQIDSNTSADQFLRLYAGGIGNSSNTSNIDITATVVVVDPFGYVWDKFAWQLSCSARFACGGSFKSLALADYLKTYPGTWKVLVVDEKANTLLLSKALTVTTTSRVNQAPIVTASAEAINNSTKVKFTLSAKDLEHDAISVIWHPPGARVDRDGDGFLDNELKQALGPDGVAVQTIDFLGVGTYTLFVELRDNNIRYNGSGNSDKAGDGFSNLLRFTVNLPFSGIAGGVNLFAQHDAQSNSEGEINADAITLAKVAAQSFSALSTAGSTTAGFLMGASSDGGNTTTTTFKSGSKLLIAGTIKPQIADLNKSGGYYVVIHAVIDGRESWLQRDSTGAYTVWSQRVSDLLPVLKTNNLASMQSIEVYQGLVGVGNFQIFLGYKLDGSTVLHYSGSPLSVTVSN